ncbi:MAG TPA: chemotaxis protein CheW [Candidatus Baltobacteraceae bacterium]
MTAIQSKTLNSHVDALAFELDDLCIAISTQPVVEILRAVAYRPIAGQPPFVPGVIDVRGVVIPLMDMRARFGRPVQPLSPEHRFILVQTHSRPIAMWVDGVIGILTYDPNSLIGSEGLLVGTRSFEGILRTPEGLVVIHDPEAFISESELDAVSEASLTT